jgi:hypothetical protein
VLCRQSVAAGIIDQTSLIGPTSTTIKMWTRKKSTISIAQIKWIDRANGRPPKTRLQSD